MSVEYHCDSCGKKLSEHEAAPRIKSADRNPMVEIITGHGGVWNAGHFCTQCIRLAVNRAITDKEAPLTSNKPPRAIKFRAWDKEMEKMYTELSVYPNGFRIPNNSTTGHDIRWEDKKPRAILMQYTGLQDKNGTEIYEGDVVGGHPHATVTKRDTFKIGWNNEYACFDAVDVETGEDYGLLGNALKDCGDVWQVLGNIYEHPDLLKEAP